MLYLESRPQPSKLMSLASRLARLDKQCGPEEIQQVVTAGGTTNRNRPAFEKTFASVLAEVRKDPPDTEKENPA